MVASIWPIDIDLFKLSSATPQVSNLVIGVYKCLLTVSDGTYSSTDEMKIIVSESGNANPSVTIISPGDGASFAEGATIDLTAQASDLDGTITQVEFFAGETKLEKTLLTLLNLLGPMLHLETTK